jgi:hypothetical protein
MEPVLVQLHWQNRADPKQTEFVGQCPAISKEQVNEWAKELISRRSGEMPDGWCPMLCTQDAPEFAWAVKDSHSLGLRHGTADG